jgi:hypothetical protein
MSSQGPNGPSIILQLNSALQQRDASTWTQLLKRQKTYRGLLGNTGGVASDILQSNQLQTDYRIGAAACGVTGPYPQLRTGQGC